MNLRTQWVVTLLTVQCLKQLVSSSSSSSKFASRHLTATAHTDTFLQKTIKTYMKKRTQKSHSLKLVTTSPTLTTRSFLINTTQSLLISTKRTTPNNVNKSTTRRVYQAFRAPPMPNRTMTRENICAYSLQQEDGHPWSCRVQYSSDVCIYFLVILRRFKKIN